MYGQGMIDLCPVKRLFAVLILLQYSASVNAVAFRFNEFSGSWDTILTYGHLYRVQSRSKQLVGVANGGSAFSINGDDGNLNYDPGLVAATGQFTTELDLVYKNHAGIFFRGSGFGDHSIDKTDRTPLSNDAKRLVESNLVLRDLFAWLDFSIGKVPGTIKVGEQVLSWGESTFIQNGINTINPVDVSRLRTPGAEVREALIPVGMIWGDVAITENISVEAFYQYDWEQTVIDPPGSYFSTNDFVGKGGVFAVAAGFGGATLPVTDRSFMDVFHLARGPDREPANGGEYGMAIRVFTPILNATEFGFYYINYHSKLPIVNAISGNSRGRLTDARYFISYPEDIQLLGFSFNNELGQSGIAIQGEYSYRRDAPFQIDLEELLAAGLGVPNQITPAGSFSAGNRLDGFILRDSSQFQFTVSKIFGPTLKASSAFLLGEFAITHVHNLPAKRTFRLEAPHTFVPATASVVLLGQPASEPLTNFPDATAYGYRLVGRLDYNNALFNAVNLQPRFGWQHDIHGISPGPGGNFIEGRKSFNLGLRAIYQNQWEVDMSYTNFFGAGRQNLIHDRDFFAFNVKYSF